MTISGNNGMVSSGLLELQTGGKFESTVTPVMWTDYVAVAGGKGTTEYKAVGTAGNEIINLYLHNTNGTLGEAFTQDVKVGPGKFTYDPDTKELAFAEGAVPDGAEVVAYYNRQIKASVLTNMSDTYSGKAKLYIDAFCEDKCGNVFRMQFYIPKADFNGEFDLEMGDNQTVHAFEAESLAGAGCGTHNSSGMLWTYTVFGANDEDYVSGAEHMAVPAATAAPGGVTGKKVSDLIGEDVAVAWDGLDGTVTGSLKHVTEWTQFSGVKDEQEGHYFPLSLDKRYAGKAITCTGSTTRTAVDTEWVLRVDKCKKFAFACDGEVILTLDFSKAALAA